MPHSMDNNPVGVAPVMGHEPNVTPILIAGSPFVHAPTVLVNEVTELQDDVR